MISRLLWLALAGWFGALSRATLFQSGVFGEGRAVRLLRWAPLAALIELAGFGVEPDDFGEATGAMRGVKLFLGAVFAIAAVSGLAFVFLGEPY